MHNWPISHLTAPSLCDMTEHALEPHSVLLNALGREVPAQAAGPWLHCQHKHGYDSVMCSLPWPNVSSLGASSDTMMLPRVLIQALHEAGVIL